MELFINPVHHSPGVLNEVGDLLLLGVIEKFSDPFGAYESGITK